MRKCLLAAFVAVVSVPALAADVSQESIDGCIDQLRAVGGPDGQSGTVVSTEFSEANSLVMLRDRGETLWRCLVSNDGIVAEMSVAQAMDDGQGAMAGAGSEGGTTTEQVRFAAGTSGTELIATLAPGASARYVLGARDGQFLYVRVAPRGGPLDFQIFNPDGSFLLDMISSDNEYRGQLWQNGEHVVEVINRSNADQTFNVIFGID